MKIVLLDRKAIGYDTPLSAVEQLGDLTVYDTTDASEIVDRIAEADVIILNKVKITSDVMEKAPKLRLVCVFATGFDNIDIAYAKKKGIAVCNVPAYSTESVALYTLTTVLALFTHLNEYADYVSSGKYSISTSPNLLEPVYHEMKGKTWGIVGLGNIGKRVAELAAAFGAKIIANKRTPLEGYECVDINTLCTKADIITVHCPLNEETKSLINTERIHMMKDGVIIVNMARGAVLDEAAVADALLNGKIGAFGCDVYSSEPFDKAHPYNSILDRRNVILTPHCAWGSYEARERCINIIADNIIAFFDGKIQNRVEN